MANNGYVKIDGVQENRTVMKFNEGMSYDPNFLFSWGLNNT